MQLERLCAAQALSFPERTLTEPRRAALDRLQTRLNAAMPALLERRRHAMDAAWASLRALNPASVMDRGYAVVRQGAGIVDGVKSIDMERPVWLCFKDGSARANVTAILPSEGHHEEKADV